MSLVINSASEKPRKSNKKLYYGIAAGTALAIVIALVVFFCVRTTTEEPVVVPEPIVTIPALTEVQRSIKSQVELLSNKDAQEIEVPEVLKALEDLKKISTQELNAIKVNPLMVKNADNLIKAVNYMSSEKKDKLTQEMADTLLSVADVLKCYGDLKTYVKENLVSASISDPVQVKIVVTETIPEPEPPVVLTPQVVYFDEEIKKTEKLMEETSKAFDESLFESKATEEERQGLINLSVEDVEVILRKAHKARLFLSKTKFNYSMELYKKYHLTADYLNILKKFSKIDIEKMKSVEEMRRAETVVSEAAVNLSKQQAFLNFLNQAIEFKVDEAGKIIERNNRVFFRNGREMKLFGTSKFFGKIAFPSTRVIPANEFQEQFVAKFIEPIATPNFVGDERSFSDEQYFRFDALKRSVIDEIAKCSAALTAAQLYLSEVVLVRHFEKNSSF